MSRNTSPGCPLATRFDIGAPERKLAYEGPFESELPTYPDIRFRQIIDFRPWYRSFRYLLVRYRFRAIHVRVRVGVSIIIEEGSRPGFCDRLHWSIDRVGMIPIVVQGCEGLVADLWRKRSYRTWDMTPNTCTRVREGNMSRCRCRRVHPPWSADRAGRHCLSVDWIRRGRDAPPANIINLP
jgi:hypothetical protein